MRLYCASAFRKINGVRRVTEINLVPFVNVTVYYAHNMTVERVGSLRDLYKRVKLWRFFQMSMASDDNDSVLEGINVPNRKRSIFNFAVDTLQWGDPLCRRTSVNNRRERGPKKRVSRFNTVCLFGRLSTGMKSFHYVTCSRSVSQ